MTTVLIKATRPEGPSLQQLVTGLFFPMGHCSVTILNLRYFFLKETLGFHFQLKKAKYCKLRFYPLKVRSLINGAGLDH